MNQIVLAVLLVTFALISANTCQLDCERFSKLKCHGTAFISIPDAKEYETLCPFNGNKLSKANKVIASLLKANAKTSVTKEIASQQVFWNSLIDTVKTFYTGNAKSDLTRATNQVNSLYKTYYSQRLISSQGKSLKTIIANKKDALEYQSKVATLVTSVVVVGLSTECQCTSFIADRYKKTVGQPNADAQWNGLKLQLGLFVKACGALKSATDSCKKYAVVDKDLSCATLGKDCPPAIAKINLDAQGKIKSKLPSGQFKEVESRNKEAPAPLQTGKFVAPSTGEKKVEPKPEPKPEPTKPTAPTTPTPSKPTTPTPTPTTPVPTPQKPVVRPTLKPLVIPTVPKKAPIVVKSENKQTTPAPASSAPKPTGSASVPTPKPATPKPATPKPATPTPKPVKVPQGPNVYKGKKKTIEVYNQK